MEEEDNSTHSQSSTNDYENGKIVISNSCWALALNDSDSLFNNDRQKEEKIYEDLCYVTFSSAFPEVNNNESQFEKNLLFLPFMFYFSR